MSEKKPVKRSRVILVILAAVLVSGGTGWALWAFLRGPNTGRFEPVISAIGAGKLDGDVIGRVNLSRTFPGVQERDEMYLTRRGDGSFVAMFPTYYGKGTSIGGLVYTSRPLREEDTEVKNLATTLDRRVIKVGRWALDLDRRIDEHWYRVSKGMH